MIGQNLIRRQCTIGLICLVLLPGTVNAADFAIASAHPLATKAGIEILASGGNAFDAAIAVTSTLAVVGPYSSGIGGGGFYLLHQQKSESTGDARRGLRSTRDWVGHSFFWR